MKKNEVFSLKEKRFMPIGKILKIMKVFTFIMLVFAIHVTARSYSQNTRLSMNLQNVSIKQVLAEIENQSEFRFLYSDSKINVEKIVDVDFNNKPVEDILRDMFQGSNIQFKVAGRQILLSNSTDSFDNLQQQKSVSGKVTDSAGALPGVSVVVKGTTTGTITDSNGSYSLSNVPANATLQFSFVGMKMQEIVVGNKTSVNVMLEEETVGLEEVVAVGYGVQRKSDLTGSVISVKSAELTKISAVNATESLQTKAPGVQVLSQGAPGSAPLIRVRGVGSNSNPNPLFVVDGMFVDDINYLNSHDIESMEVLKDASATAIYGARGANGVILVTTKQGKTGAPVVSFSGSEGVQYLTLRPKVMNGAEYAQMRNSVTGTTAYPNPDSYGEGTDWLNECSRTANVRDYQLGVAGGSDNVHYNLSIGYFGQEGTFKFTNYDRLTVRVNSDYKLGNKIKVGHNLSVSNSNNTNPSFDYLFVRSIYRISPLLLVYDNKGNFTNPNDGQVINPYALLYYNRDYNNNDLRFVGNFWGNLEILPGLTFRTSYGMNWLFNHFDQYITAYTVVPSYQSNTTNSYANKYGKDHTWLWENTLSYDKQIGENHHLNFLAGVTSQKRTADNLTGLGKGYIVENEDYISISSSPSTTRVLSADSPIVETMLSYLGRVNYSFKNRYLFTGTMRADGSSKFGINNRWGYFPSMAIGWRIKEENFLKNVNWLTNLKFRGSWGQIGNDKIRSGVSYALVTQTVEYDPSIGGVTLPSAYVSSAYNPDIKWERTEQTDLGFEMGLLENRISMEFDYFNRDTKDLLLQIPIKGGTAGIAPTFSNAASIRNRGFEFSLGWEDRIKDFKYGAKFTGSTFKNTVLDYAKQITTNNIFSTNLYTRIEEGQPLGYFYGYKSIGIYRAQADLDKWNQYAVSKGKTAYHSAAGLGDLIFEDVNGDGQITASDKTNIGTPYPKFTGSLTLNASYKNFDISADLFGSFGSQIVNDAYNRIESLSNNLNVDYNDAWSTTNTDASMPRIVANSAVNYQMSTFNVFSGDYMKLRNIELGYTLEGKSWLQKLKIKNLRVFVNGTNLFYVTKYKLGSPEVSSGDLLSQNVDLNGYPVSSNLRFGVNVKF